MVEEAIILEDSDELIDINENFKLTAGPGSGKTRFLINHIKNVINSSDKLKNGSKIACITHTNIAVDTIKERLGTSTLEVEVNTIHHFLYKHVVKPYLWIINGEMDINFNSFPMKQCFPSNRLLPKQFSWVWNDKGQEYIFNILRKLNWGFDGEHNLYVKQIGIQEVPYDFLDEYKKNCWENGLISPEDILYFSYKIIVKNPKILNILRIKFPYLFLDEFQDTNYLQNEIIKFIANSGIKLGIIGDYAQSIYKFQGSELESFLNFRINEDLKQYELRNNHRSNVNIVNILNHIRRDDFKQKSLQKKQNFKITPTIIIGDEIEAYNKTKSLLKTENFYSLSYKSSKINGLKFKLTNGENIKYISEDEINTIFNSDSTYHRRLIIRYTILAIESFRIEKINEAIKYMKFAYKKFDFDNYKSIKDLYRLNSEYDNFKQLSITDFYNNFIYGYYDVKFQIRNQKQSRVKENYDNYTYLDFSLNLHHQPTDLKFRTIHSCKGQEFDNVALFLEKENDLDFLLNPNIIENETHRVYYVALSRAKENLIINIPELDSKNKNFLKNISFDIITL